MPADLKPISKVTRLQTGADELAEFLLELVADVQANQVLGLAIVIQRASGVITTWQTQTGPALADRFRIAGGLGYLQHRIYQALEGEGPSAPEGENNGSEG